MRLIKFNVTMCGGECLGSEDLRCERDDLHERTFTKLTSDGSKDPSSARVVVLVDDDNRIRVEA